MLRKSNFTTGTDTSPATAAGNDYEIFVDHDNDKHSKIKRQKDSQTKILCFCLGIIILLVVIATVRLNHSNKYTPERLRKHSSRHKITEKDNTNNNSNTNSASLSLSHHDNEPAVVMTDANDFLPPYSIYKLEVENINGELIQFSKFRGMVTLVVNVACN